MPGPIPLPKLTIKPYPDLKGPPVSMDQLSIQIDGVEVKGLQRLAITLETLEANVVEMDFVVGELDVDIAALQSIQANARRNIQANKEDDDGC